MVDAYEREQQALHNQRMRESRERKELRAEIDQLRADLSKIEEIANIPPSDDRYGTLGARMTKVWLLARGNGQSATNDDGLPTAADVRGILKPSS